MSRRQEIIESALDRIEADAEAVFAEYRKRHGWPEEGWPAEGHRLLPTYKVEEVETGARRVVDRNGPLHDRDWRRLRVASLLASRAGRIRQLYADGSPEAALALAVDTLAQLPGDLAVIGAVTGKKVRNSASLGGLEKAALTRKNLQRRDEQIVRVARELLREHPLLSQRELARRVGKELEMSEHTVRRQLRQHQS